MSKLVENVRQATQPLIAEMGFELADVEFAQERDTGWVLTLYIYKEGGVHIDDCEAVSRAVEPIIDEIDPSDAAYFLSVSSLGLDRPFKTLRDFERYLDKQIELRFYVAPKLEEWLLSGEPPSKTPARGKKNKGKDKELVATLRAIDDQTLQVEADGRLYRIGRQAVALVRPHIEF